MKKVINYLKELILGTSILWLPLTMIYLLNILCSL